MFTHRIPAHQNIPQQLATLVGLTHILNSSHEIEQQLSLLVAEIARVLEARYAIFHLYHEERNEIWSHYLWEGELKQVQRPFGRGIAEYVIQHAKIVNVADVQQDVQLRLEIARLGHQSAESCLLVPILNRNGKPSGCIQVINKRNGHFDQQDTQYLMVMADLISIAIHSALCWKEAREGKRLAREIRNAVDIQRRLLPAKVPQIPGYEMFAFNQPSKYVGGDYYDFFNRDHSVGLVLADVSGKGLPAAMLTANLQASLHAHAPCIESCKDMVGKINEHFYRYTTSDMFATFFCANLDPFRHHLRYVNAGHIPPLLVRPDGTVDKLRSGGLPIGILKDFAFEEAALTLNAGESVVVFSDGITEVPNSQSEQFGKNKLMEIVRRNSELPARALGKAILNHVRHFSGQTTFADDMTLMVLKRAA